jgi:hypothetical protein
MKQANFTHALEQELHLQGITFSRADLLAFVAAAWPLITENLDVTFWARQFIEVGHAPVTACLISVTGGFLKFVSEALDDVKRQDLANVDANLVKLKRRVLAEKFEEFESGLDIAVKQEKAKIEQDLISRGLANTTVLQSSFWAIETDAATEYERISGEYDRAIEELALIERKLEVQTRWWKKVLRRCGLWG